MRTEGTEVHRLLYAHKYGTEMIQGQVLIKRLPAVSAHFQSTQGKERHRSEVACPQARPASEPESLSNALPSGAQTSQDLYLFKAAGTIGSGTT